MEGGACRGRSAGILLRENAGAVCEGVTYGGPKFPQHLPQCFFEFFIDYDVLIDAKIAARWQLSEVLDVPILGKFPVSAV